MIKETFCPGKNLETLLEFTEQDEFECLMMEPSLKETAEILKKDEPYITEEEILQVYKHDLRVQVENRRATEQLFEYGNSREEILNGLKEHVNHCKTCFSRYMNYLIRDTNRHFKNAEGINLEEENQNYTRWIDKAGLFGILKLLDEDYLKLLD